MAFAVYRPDVGRRWRYDQHSAGVKKNGIDAVRIELSVARTEDALAEPSVRRL